MVCFWLSIICSSFDHHIVDADKAVILIECHLNSDCSLALATVVTDQIDRAVLCSWPYVERIDQAPFVLLVLPKNAAALQSGVLWCYSKTDWIRRSVSSETVLIRCSLISSLIIARKRFSVGDMSPAR